MNNRLRITGLATGLDVDEMVKKMMQGEKIKVDRVKQKRQKVQWQQDMYRDIISDLRLFDDKYLKVGREDFILGSKTFSVFSSESTNKKVATAEGYAGALKGTYSIDVKQLAATAKLEGQSLNKSGQVTDISKWAGKDITFKVGYVGDPQTITVGAGASSVKDVCDSINAQINTNDDLRGQVAAQMVTTKDGKSYIKFNGLSNEKVKITDSTVVGDLDNIKGKVINANDNTTLADLGMAGDKKIKVTWRNKVSEEIVLKEDDTLKEAMNKIYSTKFEATKEIVGTYVKVDYSELTQKFTMQSRDSGEETSIKITSDDGSGDFKEGPNNLGFLGINDGEITGKNAIAEITTPDGVTTPIVKSSNGFTIDDINYNLNEVGQTDVTLTPNVDDSYDKIKGFIDDYNKIIKKITTKVQEKKNYSFKPLTEEQKEGMSEEQIKKWEEKAKKGLLKNDNLLENLLSSVRGAFYDKVEGAGVSITEIGLHTSKDFRKGAQIEVNEEKLKTALREKGDQVKDILTKTYEFTPEDVSLSDKEKTKKKYENSGVFQRIKDVLYENVGKFDGHLLEKAGIEGGVSEFTNQYTEELDEKDKVIKELNKKLYEKEERYYQMFARLETAMNSLNAQSNWLYQQLGMGGQQ